MVTSVLCSCNCLIQIWSSCNIADLVFFISCHHCPCSLGRMVSEAPRTGFCRKEENETILEIGNREEEVPWYSASKNSCRSLSNRDASISKISQVWAGILAPYFSLLLDWEEKLAQGNKKCIAFTLCGLFVVFVVLLQSCSCRVQERMDLVCVSYLCTVQAIMISRVIT